MYEQFLAVLMGVVEGLTEFLPVSSTGHLIIAGDLTDFEKVMGGKPAADAFEIIIQLGAILAVVAAYPRRFTGLLRFRDNKGLSGFRGLWLLAITSVPASIAAFFARESIQKYLFNKTTVSMALIVGAVWILIVERFRPKSKVENVDGITWREALAIGLFQCLSLWPGMSRSASTILGGMIVGVDRKAATEYSFFAAVPIMCAATLYEFYKSYSVFEAAQLQILAIGFVVSFISAWVAVKTFIRFLARHTLVPFGWYRLAVGGAVLWLALRGLD
ncbi:MAG: undecaprenyl-diphosphate phosphatase [Pirellulales bacterium]|nr:undecaprenyl-diphosphate phosphatase [Pirellulales bacterium]